MKKAFTLIEILIVLTVIAVLVSIVLPSLFGLKQEANLSKASTDLAILQTSIEAYYNKNHYYPIDENDYQTELIQETGLLNSYYNDPFIKKDSRYAYHHYEAASGKKYFLLISPGLNRQLDFDTAHSSAMLFIDAGQFTMPENCDDLIVTNLLRI